MLSLSPRDIVQQQALGQAIGDNFQRMCSDSYLHVVVVVSRATINRTPPQTPAASEPAPACCSDQRDAANCTADDRERRHPAFSVAADAAGI